MRLTALFVVAALAWLARDVSEPTPGALAVLPEMSATSAAAASRGAAAHRDGGCVTSPDYRLVATLAVESPLLPSMAVVTDDLRPSKVVAEGGALGGHRVERIDRTQVVLSGAQCVRRGARTASLEEPAPAPAVRRVGRRIEVPRALVQGYLDDLQRLRMEVRVGYVGRPPDGRFKVRWVRARGVFAHLFRRGDTIETVAGRPVRTLGDALTLFESLKDESEVDLSVGRRGKQVDYTLALAD